MVDKKVIKVDAEYMNNKNLFLGIFGVILTIAGVALFNFGSTPEGAKADTSYSSNWQASKVYRLRHTNNVGNSTDLGAIGVSEWTVNGTVGQASFTETWSAPDPSTTSIDTGGNNSCRSSGYDRNKWLTSCLNLIGSGEGTVTFSLTSVAPNTVFTEGPKRSGGAVECVYANTCISTTGAYGFTSVSTNQEVKLIGVFMPLQWSVTGTIR